MSQPACFYQICGLNVAAQMSLPGAIALQGEPAQVDVRIRQAAVPTSLDKVAKRGPGWELDGQCFLLNLPGVGRFFACNGNTLDMAPEPGTDPADAMPFLLGTGIGAILHQRGGLVLHAATVAWEGRAYVFCAPSGGGKSTLAAALCRAGCQFVADDVTAVGLDADGRPQVWPDGRSLKLFDTSIRHLALEAGRGSAVRTNVDKHYVEPAGGRVEKAVPLAAIYLLRDQRLPLEVGLQPRLSPVKAAQILLNNSYRRRLALATAGQGNHMAPTAAVAGQVPICELIRPRDLDRLDDTVALLLDRWRHPAH